MIDPGHAVIGLVFQTDRILPGADVAAMGRFRIGKTGLRVFGQPQVRADLGRFYTVRHSFVSIGFYFSVFWPSQAVEGPKLHVASPTYHLPFATCIARI